MVRSRRMLRLVVCAFFALFLCSAFSFGAQAAKAPSKPKKLKAECTESKVTLTWKVSDKANGYMVYMKKGSAE